MVDILRLNNFDSIEGEKKMTLRFFVSIFAFSIGALIIGIIGWISGNTVLGAYGLGVLSIGLGVNSLMISLNTNRRTNSMEATLTRIESLQGEFKKAQEEQPSSQKPIIASLQSLSQYYFDSIAKKKSTDDK